jgi:iduronate 2-sulfatase
MWISVALLVLVAASVDTKPNVLFLVSDDMRQQLGCYYGPDFPAPVFPKMHTPRLDELASRSLLLKKAYVQQAVCNPSRPSTLTSRRPDTTHVYDAKRYFRRAGGNFTTIPQFFKQQGYTSAGFGKIFHPGPAASGDDDPISWSMPYYHSPNEQFWKNRQHGSWKAVSKETRAKRELPDIQVAQKAVEVMQQLAKSPNPFFLGVGFHKPHLPFIFPEEFLNLYPEKEIRLPDNPYAPVEMPYVAWHRYNGVFDYPDMKGLNISGEPNTTVPDFKVKELRRAYYSALSYTDYLVGFVLDALKKLGLEKQTIVAFWGDHGWQLGEHGEWSKQTNFELATHAPMMLHIPGVTDDGIVTEHITEFVDLFPTLVEAAGFPSLPLCPEHSANVSLCTEGTSLMPLLKTNASKEWKDVAFSQFPRSNKKMGQVMGYTMRTQQYRYTEWAKFTDVPEFKPDWNTLHGVELYDHTSDPEENHNRAHDVKYHDLREELSRRLRAGWRGLRK